MGKMGKGKKWTRRSVREYATAMVELFIIRGENRKMMLGRAGKRGKP